MRFAEGLALAALRRLDPEVAHRVAMAMLKSGMAGARRAPGDPRLAVELAGLRFPNPLGLAAGFDKNAEAPDAMLRVGFGFVEVGTLTPHPQLGNPKPRIFRLNGLQGAINRLGFNNEGHAAALARLEARRRLGGAGGIVGVNVGANKDSADLAGDYVAGIGAFWGVADYFTVNISSPNTPGLRALQAGEALSALLGRVIGRRDELQSAGGQRRPVFLKIAPDLDARQMDEIAGIVAGSGIDGLVVSNTTIARHGLAGVANSGEAGGLSGRPLFERSTIVLARMRMRLGPRFPIIGVGGIDSTSAAIAKLEAGADLLQLYTGMIWRGPGLATDILAGLSAELDRRGVASVKAITGLRTAEWAARALPEER